MGALCFLVSFVDVHARSLGFRSGIVFTDRTAYLWESSRGTGTPSLVLSGTSVIYHKENQRHMIRLKLVLAILLLLIEDSLKPQSEAI